MTAGLVVLVLAAVAMTGFAASLAVWGALLLGRGRLEALRPEARSRVLFAATLLPALASGAVTAAVFAPSFGWIADHCAASHDAHWHPHICTTHAAEDVPALSLLALAALLLVRVLGTLARLVETALAASTAGRALRGVTSTVPGLPARVLPMDEPRAFALGLLRPIVYVTRGLVSGPHRDHLPAVLAHESAHVRRRDPLRRLAAIVALPFHLPGLASRLERLLAESHEMAADAEAARRLGSPSDVALALVRLSRASVREPAWAASFSGSNVEARVALLLDGRPRPPGPGALSLVLAGLACAGLVALGAEAVHHGVESLLGLLGG